MEYAEKLAKAHELFEEAKTLFSGAASQEDREKATKMVEDATALKKDALQMKDIEAAMIDLDVEGAGKPTPGRKFGQDKVTAKKQWKYWGEYLEAVHEFNVSGKLDPRLKVFRDVEADNPTRKEGKDMTGATGSAGGFLIPTEFQAELYSIMAERSIVRPRATVIPMRRRAIDIPVLDQTTTTAGIPHWFGGMQFYWAEEAEQKTPTDPKWRKVTLNARKLIGYTRASDELLDDAAVSLEAFLSGPMGFAGGAAWMEDFAFLRGSGAGQPLGILNSGASISQARSVAGQINYIDIINMYEKFLPSGNGIWLASQSTFSDLIQMNGPAGNPSYVWTGGQLGQGAVNQPPGNLFGMPIIFTEKLPPAYAGGDLMLVDFSYYLIGDRESASVESTRFERFQFDQTSWRMVHRVDGQPWLSAPITYQDGATTVSPFVFLAT